MVKETQQQKAGRLGGQKSSRAGIPNRDTVRLTERLEELGCDPLELSAKIAMGEELDGPHPSYTPFLKILDNLNKLVADGKEVTANHLLEIQTLVEGKLASGYVPYDLRSKHIADLMQYRFPKRKAVEVDSSNTTLFTPTLDVDKLSTEAMRELLAATFDAPATDGKPDAVP